jgi:hypothetical protein
VAAPLYYRLLVTGEELDIEHADEAAAAALAAARAGVFAGGQVTQPGRTSPAS